LLKACFQEKPEDRPNFKVIKQAIQHAYNEAIQHDECAQTTQGNILNSPLVYLQLAPIGQSTSNEMLERYKRMKNENKRTIFGLKTDEINPIVSTISFGPPPLNSANVPDRCV
jgi:hypothetical protein